MLKLLTYYVIFVQMTNASEAATKEEFVLQFSMSVSAQKDFTKKEINVWKVDFPIKNVCM